MPVDSNYSYKHRNIVRVTADSKTDEGKNILDDFRRDQRYQRMDIGRIGRHMPDGQYKIEPQIVAEFITIPKIIMQVREKAFDKAGKDVYELKTFLSRFGELDFMVTIDKDQADLYFIEHVHVDNICIHENYSTLIYSLHYANQNVPIKEIFYKFNISANPDDYGKRWKDIDITNTLVAKTKAALAVACVANVAATIVGNSLDSSIKTIGSEAENFGKKVVSTYNKIVKKSPELKTPNLSGIEVEKTNILLNTIENLTTIKELQKPNIVKSINNVLEIQTDASNELFANIQKNTTPLCICNKFTELQESSVATIEDAITKREMVNGKLEEIKPAQTYIETLPDGTQRVVMLVEPTDCKIENFDIKNESIVTQFKIMTSPFDDVTTIDGTSVDISIDRFGLESENTIAIDKLRELAIHRHFDLISLEDEKEFKKKIRRLTNQQAEEIKKLREEYREQLAKLSPKQSNIVFQELDKELFMQQQEMLQAELQQQQQAQPQLSPEETARLAEEAQQEQAEGLQEQLQEEQDVAPLSPEEEEEQARKRARQQMQDIMLEEESALAEQELQNEQEILERQQEQAEELQEEVIESQQNGESIKEHLENVSQQKEEIEKQNFNQEQQQQPKEDVIILGTEKTKVNEEIANKEKEEQEKARQRKRLAEELEIQQRQLEAQEKLENQAPPITSEFETSNNTAHSTGSTIFETEKQNSSVETTSEGLVFKEEPPKKQNDGPQMEL